MLLGLMSALPVWRRIGLWQLAVAGPPRAVVCRRLTETMAANTELSIPTLDIAPYVAWRASLNPGDDDATPPPAAAAVVAAWRDAYATYGFSQVVGHGVADAVIEDAHGLARQFFETTTEDERDAVADEMIKDRGRGYKRQGVVAVAGAGVSADGRSSVARPADYAMEYIALCDGRDPGLGHLVDGLNEAIDAYFHAMLRLNCVFMELTALALGLARSHFAEAFGGNSWLNRLRCAYYPSQKGLAPKKNQLRYGEHTDWQAFTLLWQDHNALGFPQCSDVKAGARVVPPPGGLQVEVESDLPAPAGREGTRPGTVFVDCKPECRALTVNAGDQIEVWTNGVFKSCVHRVANPPPGCPYARLSLVLFTGPQPETPLAPLPTCVTADRPAKFPATTSGAHLQAKIKASTA